MEDVLIAIMSSFVNDPGSLQLSEDSRSGAFPSVYVSPQESDSQRSIAVPTPA